MERQAERERLMRLIDEMPPHEGKTFEAALADYLLENGVIVPLCKVGDTVWDRDVEPYTVISIEWFSRKVTQLHCVSPVTGRRRTFSVGKRSIGKTVFLTKEAAENALKGGAN